MKHQLLSSKFILYHTSSIQNYSSIGNDSQNAGQIQKRRLRRSVRSMDKARQVARTHDYLLEKKRRIHWKQRLLSFQVWPAVSLPTFAGSWTFHYSAFQVIFSSLINWTFTGVCYKQNLANANRVTENATRTCTSIWTKMWLTKIKHQRNDESGRCFMQYPDKYGLHNWLCIRNHKQ